MTDPGRSATPEVDVRDGVLRLRAPGATWLSTGWAGGRRDADAAFNISVPEGWARTDLDSYVAERLAEAGVAADGPALLTGVATEHARAARLDAERAAPDADANASVLAVATAGVSNPAALFPEGQDGADAASSRAGDHSADEYTPGTVNVVLYADRALTEGALANLLAVVAEAKTAALARETGFPGTTTDAAIVGCPAVDEPGGSADGEGDVARFSGSGTPIGAAARACVRDAVLASLRSRYADRELPTTVADAEYGVATTRTSDVFDPAAPSEPSATTERSFDTHE